MPKHSMQFEAIGTYWSIETESLLSNELKDKIHDRIETFDKTYSRFRNDSLVAKITQSAGIYTFPSDANELFAFYKKLYDATDGKVTPLIGGMLEKAGYDATYSFIQKPQEGILSWEEVLDFSGNLLKVNTPVTLDIGAAGKGYLVDSICQLLDESGVNEYAVDASGDIRHKGVLENKVGLEHPYEEGKVIGVIDIQNKSLCASAINRRQWGNGQHHIFDPDLMAPTDDVVATWVIADSTMIADGIATALFFTEPAKLRKEFAYEFLRIRKDGAIDYSPAFEGKLF